MIRNQTSIELEIKTDWTEMSNVFESALGFFERAGFGADAVNTYTMVVCELVENGIKYAKSSNDEHPTVHVSVRISNQTVTIQVTNPINVASRPHLQNLDRTIQWVRGYQDPFEAFIERMKEISREPLELPKSGLGIVRVAVEGRAALDFFLGEDNMLSVLAVSRIEN